MELKKTVSIVLTATLLLSMLLVAIPKVSAQATTVEIVPSLVSVTAEHQLITVSCMVYDVIDLAGFDIIIQWDPAYLDYDSHTVTLDCLVPPTFAAKDVVNMTTSQYWLAAATLSSPLTGFNGDGEAYEITFEAINVPIGTPGDYLDTYISFVSVALSDTFGIEIPGTTMDGTVRIYYREAPPPPPVPMLKVDPPVYEAMVIGEACDISAWLMGAGETDLSPDWDVAAIDVYMNFDPTLIEAFSVDIDPEGEFEGFWPNGLYMLIGWNGTTPDDPYGTNLGYEIDNVEGWVRVAYMGVPHSGGAHTKPYGKINMFTVTFNAIVESTTYPPPTCDITLANPIVTTGNYIFDALAGLIDPDTPLSTEWFQLVTDYGSSPYMLTDWVDNGDGTLSPSDQIILEGPDGFYFDYHLDYMTGTLKLQQQPFYAGVWEGFAMDGPVNDYTPWQKLWTTGASGDGYGVANKTGTFALPFPASSINYFTVYPQFGAPYNLTEGVDFIVNPDGTVDLLTGLDERVENEYVGNMTMVYDNGMAGWPGLGGIDNWYNIVASSFESIYIDMHNGTARYARNNGYYLGPPSEYWYDDWFPYEIESYWATGYFSGTFTWPDATDIWINYTAPAWVEIDYNAIADPDPRYIEFRGTYADFLTSMVSPVGSEYDEAYPRSWRDYVITGWDDTDPGGMLSVGDFIYTIDTEGIRSYEITGITTNIGLSRKQWICEEDPGDLYFGWAPIVRIAGFPQPDSPACPWHNKDYSVPLPHVVANGVYTTPFKPLGGFIDVFVCNYEQGFKGEGKDKPADMFWPQKEIMLCADVTYAGWPEQNKDVAFEIKFPNGTVYVVMYNRTNEVGFTFVRVRLPWPCDNPEAIFGVWKVFATVDVACVVVNDTMEFKYDYRINIWNVSTNKEEYKHCEDIIVTVDYGSYLIQTSLGHLIITVTVTDASGVPIGFDYIEITLGTDDMADWCKYLNGTVELSVHVVKWARPPIGTIYVGALTDFPQNGGSAETPVYVTQVAILAEWAI